MSETKNENNVDDNNDNTSSGRGSQDGAFECNICLDTARDAVVSLCGHLFWWAYNPSNFVLNTFLKFSHKFTKFLLPFYLGLFILKHQLAMLASMARDSSIEEDMSSVQGRYQQV